MGGVGCGTTEWAALAGRFGDLGVALPARRWSPIIYGAAYYQNILIVFFAGCSAVLAGGAEW